MLPALFIPLALMAFSATSPAAETHKAHKAAKKMTEHSSTQVKFETSLGDFVLELDKAKAPATVANFLSYVKEGFYDGTIFHRVIPGFMAQGGGYTADYQQKATHPPVKNEADNGLVNKRGSIAMARTSDPNSATAQFFINFIDNTFLNYKSATPNGWGYAVFGEVVQGLDVVDSFSRVPSGPAGPFASDVPKTAIVIKKATVVSE
jgi:peptidyl-prolyl cis-trans isomerase B (cyclophilin B)